MNAKDVRTYGWTKDDAALIEQALLREIPNHPFVLHPYSIILSPDEWKKSLIEDIKRGPKGPRNLYLAVVSDIQALLECPFEKPKQKQKKQRIQVGILRTKKDLSKKQVKK